MAGTSTAMLPADWAPSTSSGPPTACTASAIGGRSSVRPVVHSTCDTATIRVRSADRVRAPRRRRRTRTPRRSAGEHVQRAEDARVLLRGRDDLVALVPVEAGHDQADALRGRRRERDLLGRRADDAAGRLAGARRAPPSSARSTAGRCAARRSARRSRRIASIAGCGSGPMVPVFMCTALWTAGSCSRISREYRVDRVVVGQAQRPVAVQREVAAGRQPARGGPLDLEAADEDVVDRARPTSPRSSRGRTSARTPASAAPRSGRRPAPSARRGRTARAGSRPAPAGAVVAVVGVDVGDRELAARPAVAEPHELGDPRLAAQPLALVDLRPAGGDEQQLGAVEQRVGLSLDLGAHQVGQRVARRRHRRPAAAGRGRTGCGRRSAGASVTPIPVRSRSRRPAQTGTSWSTITSGRSSVIMRGHLAQQLAADVRVAAAVGRDVDAMGDVPGAQLDRDPGVGHEGDPR